MKTCWIILTAVALATTLSAFPAQGAAYIKFDGVDGESTDKDHVGWCDMLGFQQGISRPGGTGTGPTRRRGSAILDDISVTKELDKASPKIAEAVCQGKVYPKVEIHVTASYATAGRVVYYRYELKNCWITGYAISGSGQSEDVPVEEVGIAFEEITVTYTEYDDAGNSQGNVEYNWKVEEGEALNLDTLQIGGKE